jgi:hypothetical protein
MNRPVVGQVMYLVRGDAYRRDVERALVPVTVKGVGRKYFRVQDGWRELEFQLDNWRAHRGFGVSYRLYESEQEYHDEREHGRLCSEIREAFLFQRDKGHSLATLRAIKAILDEEGKQHE